MSTTVRARRRYPIAVQVPAPSPEPLADTTTPNLGLTQPEVGASASTWGYKLNANFGILDNSLQLTGGAISGSLSVAGGMNVNGGLTVDSGGFAVYGGLSVVTGQTDLYGPLVVTGAASFTAGAFIDSGPLNAYGGSYIAGGMTVDGGLAVNSGNTTVNGTVTANILNISTVGGDFFLSGATVNHVISFYNNWYFSCNGAAYFWNTPNGQAMALDINGNLRTAGTINGLSMERIEARIAELEKQTAILLNRIRTLEERI